MEGKGLKKRKNLMITVLMMAVLTACGSDGGISQKEPIRQEIKNNTEENQEDILTDEMETEENEGSETQVGQINLDNSEGSLIYVRHEIVKDYNGADAVRIYFTYTNRSDETNTAQSTFYPQAFQNGIECEFTFGEFTETNEAESNLSKQLMKDSSLEVAFLYTLQDLSNPVTLKVNDQSADNLFEGIYQQQELILQ